MADEVVTVYRMDIQQWEAGKEEIRKGSKELVTANEKTQTSFADLSKQSAQSFSVQKVQTFSKEAGKALKDTKKETDNLTASTKNSGNAFLNMRKELKSVQGQLATLAANGRENSKLFKALSNEAGVLKDRMKDLGSSIELQAGDPVENLSTGFSQLRGSMTSLDFEGVARSLGGLAANVNKIDLKTFTQGIGGIVQSFGKLAGAIFASPIFLVAAAVTGIIAVIATWGDSLEEIRAKNDRLIAGIDLRLSITQAGYEREIALLQASGKLTSDIEKEKLREFIVATGKKLELRKKEIAFEIANAKLARKILGDEKFKEVIEASDAAKQLVEISNSILDAQNEIRIIDAKEQNEANKKTDEANKKANDDYKKRLEEKYQIAVDAFKKLSETQRFYEQQEAASITAEGQKKIDAILDKAFPERKKKTQSALEDARDVINEELVTTANDEKANYQDRQEALDESIKLGLISQEDALDLQKDITLQKIQDKKKEADAIISISADIVSIGQSLIEIARNAGMENAEAEKAFAIFGVAVNLAQSLANVIAGATAASTATGPLAPFVLPAYIASGTAAVLAAFAQVTSILNQEPPSFAEGGYTGDGGKYQPAGTVHKGEWVSTQGTTNKYWEELEAMHKGTFNDLLMYKYIEPALAQAVSDNGRNDNKSFAENIANSMRLNFKNKDVVSAILSGNLGSNKNTQKIVKAITQQSRRPSYRKK